MLPVPGYRAFSDIVEEAAKSAHGDWWPSRIDDYLGRFVGDVWSGHFKDCLYYRELGERKPSPITRDVVLMMIPTAMTVADNDHPPYPPTPWPKLAEIPFKYYDSGERGSFAKLNLSATKAQEWIEAHSAPDPATNKYAPLASQAVTAGLRGKLRKWIEETAKEQEPHLFVKSDFKEKWFKDVGKDITENLFRMAWRDANIHPDYKKRGRRAGRI